MRTILAAFAFVFSTSVAPAATLNFNFTCVLNGLENHLCDPPQASFGTLALTDYGNDTVRVTVTLGNPGQKFRDLVLNFNPASLLFLIDDDDPANTITLNPDTFAIAPYPGLFDIGGEGSQGWSGDSGYSALLTFDGPVSVGDLFHTDSGGLVFAALHIQNIGDGNGGNCTGASDGTTPCDPTQTGPGSLKIGALLDNSSDVVDTPEPASFGLAGAALLALVALRKRQAPRH